MEIIAESQIKSAENFKGFETFLILLFIIRLIQEEKQTTEQRAEELESRMGSLEHMNLLARSGGLPLTPRGALEVPRISPPISGRSTPKGHLSPQKDYLQHKYNTVSHSYHNRL